MNRHIRNSRFHAVALMAMATAACFADAAGTATSDNPAGVSAPRQPVAYLVKEKSLIGNEMFEEGSTCQYAGLPSENLEPTCDIGRARQKEYQDSNRARVAAMIDNNKGDAHALDPQVFMANMLKVQAEMAAEAADKQTVAIAGAVAQAVTAALAAIFPNGAPVSAPAAPAAPETPAAPAASTAAADATDKPAEQPSEPAPGAPAKRTK